MENDRVRGNGIGPTGQTLAFNIRRLRTGMGIDLRGLSSRLREIGRPISPSALSKLENGDRKVDADDLVALAVALNVNPNALLFPPVDAFGATLTITGDENDAHVIWDWARGLRPLHYDFQNALRPGNSVAVGREAFRQSREVSNDLFRMRVTPGYADDPGPNVY